MRRGRPVPPAFRLNHGSKMLPAPATLVPSHSCGGVSTDVFRGPSTLGPPRRPPFGRYSPATVSRRGTRERFSVCGSWILKPKTLYLERGMSGCGFREWAQSSSEEAATGQCERRHFRVRPIKPGAVQTSSWVSEADAGSFIKLEPLVERGPQGPLLESQD